MGEKNGRRITNRRQLSFSPEMGVTTSRSSPLELEISRHIQELLNG